ncbi:phosphoribosylamine--glycine ligase, partial [bacterium]
MKILIVGGGGREHALGWALAGEGREIFFAPGNGGTGNNIPITPAEIDKLAEFSQREKIDLTVVGPEAPLAEGVVDEFEKRGLKIFGPSKNASEIEASKAFAREFMKKYGIPSPHFEIVTSFE